MNYLPDPLWKSNRVIAGLVSIVTILVLVFNLDINQLEIPEIVAAFVLVINTLLLFWSKISEYFKVKKIQILGYQPDPIWLSKRLITIVTSVISTLFLIFDMEISEVELSQISMAFALVINIILSLWSKISESFKLKKIYTS